MFIRRALAAVAAGAVMVLGAATAPAEAAPIVVVDAVLGRNAPTYTSYPFDPTPTSKWVASAQGEHVDDNYVTKPDPNALRGRAAVQETFGIKRVRIYDVQLQQLRGSTWVTVARQATDVVNEASRAYAVSYTPTVKTCWWDDFVATYRVVNQHGIRRVDGIVANRTTVSKQFKAPRLATDANCPTGVVTGQLDTPNIASEGDTTDGGTWLQYFGPNNPAPAPNLSVTVNWGDGYAVQEAPAGYFPLDDTPDPNDYRLTVASFGINDPRNELTEGWTLTAVQAGEWTSSMTITTGNPLIVTQVVETQPSTITEHFVADVELQASLPSDLNTDQDPNSPGLQVTAGDVVVYRLTVTNHGPDTSLIGIIDHGWPVFVDKVTRVWRAGSEPMPYEPEPGQDNLFTWSIPRTAAGADPTVLYVEVHTTTKEDVVAQGWAFDAPEDITPTFRASPYSADDNPPEDPNWSNNDASEQFRVMPPGWLD